LKSSNAMCVLFSPMRLKKYLTHKLVESVY
jgi:hypothetical protein